MDLIRSAAAASRLIVVERTESTNAELRERLSSGPSELPSFTVLVTTTQSAGRGRNGRTWSLPAGTGLAISVLLRGVDDWMPEALSLTPLMAGLAMSRAARDLGVEAEVKWPNDVLVGERKLSGVLCERVGDCVIVGAGLNVGFSVEQAPVPTATSLAMEGVEVSLDDALHAFLVRLRQLCDEVVGDPHGVLAMIREGCRTLGRGVRVELPGGATLKGTAVDLDGTGRLIIDVNGVRTPVAAGDVTHLRY